MTAFINSLKFSCKGVMRKACRMSDAWREKMLYMASATRREKTLTPKSSAI